MKIFFKILGTIVIVILLFLFWALKKVDYSSYFESDYYESTISRFDSISKGMHLVKGNIQVGYGKKSITPTLGAQMDNPETGSFIKVPMAGFGSRKGTYAEGIHDSIFVKAMALKVQNKLLVLVGSDMLIIPPVISEGVSEQLHKKIGLKRNQIFFSATHSHSSIGAWSEGYVGEEFAGLSNPEVVQWLVQQFSQAIEIAVSDLQPGKIGTGVFKADDLISNRLIGEKGEKDPEFVFMVVNQNTGKKAILGSFDAHATTLGGWNMQISADYPGYWQRKLESEGFDMAVYFAGSVGSHSPRSKGEKFEKPRYIGEALADSVIKYSKYLELSDSTALSYMSLKMDLPEFHIRISDGIRLRPVLGSSLFPDVGDAYVQAARIDKLVWMTSPSDFSGELAIQLKGVGCRNGYNVLVTSFNGTYVGYIIPGKYYHLDEYESRLMSWFGPYMGPYNYEMMRRMLQKITSLN
jgi:hypothetical protein